jgi:Arc/MetJ family transcription regulator
MTWQTRRVRSEILMRIMMLQCISCEAKETTLRTTVTIDDELYQRALEVADPGTDKADLFREAMKVFVRVQAGKRLAALGGKMPRMKPVPRRRPV